MKQLNGVGKHFMGSPSLHLFGGVITICLTLICLVALVSCTKQPEPADEQRVESSNAEFTPSENTTNLTSSSTDTNTYDANSWQQIIPASCQSYFDGCNNCRRGENSMVAACTRKACARYEQPKCLDEAAIVEASAESNATEIKTVEYLCDGGKRFTVFYGEYRVDDQRVRLQSDQIMLSDTQAHTTYTLKRVRAASGEKYSNAKLEFWAKGDEATLLQDESSLYSNCAINTD